MDYSIILPSKPRIIEENSEKGVYEIDGLYPGYGYTFGNSLRRMLLASLPGAAITKIAISGAAHEFVTLDGVKEDVINIILNLKQVRIKLFSDEPQTIRLSVRGPKEVYASDFQVPTQVEIMNPNLSIATVTDKKKEFSIEATVERGLGYMPREEIEKEKVPTGSIVLDAVFTPVKRVNYEIENMRVGDRTDFNRLRITIQTDGTISPRAALENSIANMISVLKAVVGFASENEIEPPRQILEPAVEKNEKDDTAISSEAFKTRVEDLNLSVRVFNALSQAGIRTIGGLVKKRPEDLLTLDGIGEKAIIDIEEALVKFGLGLKK